MARFKGFMAGKQPLTPLPEQFFSELLPLIDHLGELKLTLYVFWRLHRLEGDFRYLQRKELLADKRLMKALTGKHLPAPAALDDALERALKRGTLLKAVLPGQTEEDALYFLNSPRGRAALEAISRGEWKSSVDERLTIEPLDDRPNVFALYEENIGPLTPLVAEALREAEATYPSQWLEDAFRIAVENNARNWRYISAILNRWQIEGRDERKDRQDTEKTRRRYVEGEYSDYIEH